MNDYCKLLYGNGFKCHYQGGHYIVDSLSILISQIYALRGTLCNYVSPQHAELEQQQYFAWETKIKYNQISIKNLKKLKTFL